MYEHGQGVGQSDFTAAKWYRKAAEHGLKDAQHNLGTMYENGQGVAVDHSTAMKWYCMAANQGDEEAAAAVQRILQLQRSYQAASPTASPVPILIGTDVQLRGLQAKPELNGQRGVLTGFDASTGRCSVQLEDGGGPFSIKPANLAEVVVATSKLKDKKKEATKNKNNKNTKGKK